MDLAHPRDRRFALADVLILVAAAAAAFAIIRARNPIPRFDVIRARYPASYASTYFFSAWVQQVSVPILSILTLTTLALGFRTRPSQWSSYARRPGMIACCAVVLVALYKTVLWASLLPTDVRTSYAGLILAPYTSDASLSVLVAWLALVLGGCWRTEVSWVGWMGRAVGIAWVLKLVFDWVLTIWGSFL